jgi:lysophospholipase L1-like esterase
MRKKILLLGSSMTQRSFSLEHLGWGAALANWYCRTADILNRGAGGYNSNWCKRYLSKLIGNEKPDITVLFIGNNDAIEEDEHQHVSLHDFRDNILQILEALYRVKSSMSVIIVTTTRVNEEMKPKHSNERRAQYADIIRDIVKYQHTINTIAHHSLALVDLWTTQHIKTQNSNSNSNSNNETITLHSVSSDDLYDGVHLNKSGNKKVFEKIKHVITHNTQFPHLSPDNVKHKGNKRRLITTTQQHQSSATNDVQQTQHKQIRKSSNDYTNDLNKTLDCVVNTTNNDNITTNCHDKLLLGGSLDGNTLYHNDTIEYENNKTNKIESTCELLAVDQTPLQLTVPLWHEI